MIKVRELTKGGAYALASRPMTVFVGASRYKLEWQKCVVLDPHYWSKCYHLDELIKGRAEGKKRPDTTQNYFIVSKGYGVPCMVETEPGSGEWMPQIVQPQNLVVPYDKFLEVTEERRTVRDAKMAKVKVESDRKIAAGTSLNEALNMLTLCTDPGIANVPVHCTLDADYSFGVRFDTAEKVEWLAAVVSTLTETIEFYKDYLYEMED